MSVAEVDDDKTSLGAPFRPFCGKLHQQFGRGTQAHGSRSSSVSNAALVHSQTPALQLARGIGTSLTSIVISQAPRQRRQPICLRFLNPLTALARHSDRRSFSRLFRAAETEQTFFGHISGQSGPIFRLPCARPPKACPRQYALAARRMQARIPACA